MSRSNRSIGAAIIALEDNLRVVGDLRRTARHDTQFARETDRFITLAKLEREAGELDNALRILRTHALAQGFALDSAGAGRP